MRTYEAIEAVSKSIIKENICEAILIKGSIGRGDDDEYSDVDMYVVVKQENMESFLARRMEYLQSYLPVLYEEHVNFVAPQIIAIFTNGLHFDLYTVTEDTLPHTDKAKIIYDPQQRFNHYCAEQKLLTKEELTDYFNECLYYFIEADGAYCRKNYPWAARILTSIISESAIVLRYLYDKEHAYLGLKKINEIIPAEQYNWLVEASANLNEQGFQKANHYMMKILDFIVENSETGISNLFNLNFYEWMKTNLNTTIFNKN